LSPAGPEEKAMSMTPTTPAEVVLRQQVEIFGKDCVSLDSLWRAVGEPGGFEPRAWASLAEPLLAGFRRYLAKRESGHVIPSDDQPVLWTWDAQDSEPWRAGDLMTNDWIARVYASYLDEQV
jgi:hypothetical protein